MCSQLSNGACDTICKQIVRELTKEKRSSSLEYYSGHSCCVKDNFVVQNSHARQINQIAHHYHHHITSHLKSYCEFKPKSEIVWTDIQHTHCMCVRVFSGKVVKFGGQCVHVHEKPVYECEKENSLIHRRQIALKLQTEKSFYMSWAKCKRLTEPNFI